MRGVQITKNFCDPQKISDNEKRFSKLLEKRKKSVAFMIEHRRSTIIINIVIEITAGVIFAVGLVYVMWFMRIRKSLIGPAQYRVFMLAFICIACFWFVYLFVKILSQYRLLRRTSSQ